MSDAKKEFWITDARDVFDFKREHFGDLDIPVVHASWRDQCLKLEAALKQYSHEQHHGFTAREALESHRKWKEGKE